MVTVSVPGKVNLMGEHAIVHGKPSLLAAVNLRLTVSVEPAKTLEIVSSEPTEYVRHAVEFWAKEYKLPEFPRVKITVKSDIPAGYHLGSSAAVAVGTVGALTYYLKKVWNPQAINQLAYEVEKKQHGNPSGGDNTTVTFGGLIWFRKELEFLKSIWQLPFKIPDNLNHFFLIDTGRPKETTGEMVSAVARKVKKDPAAMQNVFSENERQTKQMSVALKEGDEESLISTVRAGERTLEEMGVVSTKIIGLIRGIEKAGWAAKILGGGGKKEGVGYLLCYSTDKKSIEGIIKKYHFSTREITLGGEGIRLEQKV